MLCDLDEIKVRVDRQYENCHGYSGSKKAIYREAILAVKSILHSAKPIDGVTVQEWISASEPPNKITNKVIVLCKNGYRGYGHYEDYKGERTWYNLESGKPFTDWDLEDCESYEVTHWMPMPNPPKGECL